MRTNIETPSQRTVSAASAPSPLAGVRSAFDLVPRPPKKPPVPLPPFDPAAVVVETDVPLTDRRVRNRGAGKYATLLERLDVGSSAALPIEHAKSLRSACTSTGKRHGRKFQVRTVSDSQCRVWRTA